MKLYLLPGLGADERLFRYLDLHEHTVIPIRWFVPSGETIEEYARKISEQVEPGSILIGQSFGGMMAIEVGKIVEMKKIILISSVERFDELPGLYRLAGKIKMHRILNGWLLKNSHRMMNWVMGAADPIRKELLADMLRDTDERFLYWAIDKIVSWKNTTVPPNVFRIHGNNDRVLPMRRVDYVIDKGSHLAIADRADEVTKYIKHIFNSIS